MSAPTPYTRPGTRPTTDVAANPFSATTTTDSICNPSIDESEARAEAAADSTATEPLAAVTEVAWATARTWLRECPHDAAWTAMVARTQNTGTSSTIVREPAAPESEHARRLTGLKEAESGWLPARGSGPTTRPPQRQHSHQMPRTRAPAQAMLRLGLPRGDARGTSPGESRQFRGSLIPCLVSLLVCRPVMSGRSTVLDRSPAP